MYAAAIGGRDAITLHAERSRGLKVLALTSRRWDGSELFVKAGGGNSHRGGGTRRTPIALRGPTGAFLRRFDIPPRPATLAPPSSGPWQRRWRLGFSYF